MADTTKLGDGPTDEDKRRARRIIQSAVEWAAMQSNAVAEIKPEQTPVSQSDILAGFLKDEVSGLRGEVRDLRREIATGQANLDGKIMDAIGAQNERIHDVEIETHRNTWTTRAILAGLTLGLSAGARWLVGRLGRP